MCNYITQLSVQLQYTIKCAITVTQLSVQLHTQLSVQLTQLSVQLHHTIKCAITSHN